MYIYLNHTLCTNSLEYRNQSSHERENYWLHISLFNIQRGKLFLHSKSQFTSLVHIFNKGTINKCLQILQNSLSHKRVSLMKAHTHQLQIYPCFALGVPWQLYRLPWKGLKPLAAHSLLFSILTTGNNPSAKSLLEISEISHQSLPFFCGWMKQAVLMPAPGGW